MVIRTLKAVLINVTFITIVLNASIINAVNTQDKPIDTSTNFATGNDKSLTLVELNTLIQGSLENLDKINSILEFTAQAISRETIFLQNKASAKKWIKNNQNNIKILEKSLNDFDIDIEKIYKVNCVAKLLIAHVNKQLEQQLQNLQGFNFNLDTLQFRRSQRAKISAKAAQELIKTNLKQILGLQDKANEIGLTAVNKASRKLESLNDKYKITKCLNIIPPLLLLSIAFLYYAPLRWFGEGTQPAPSTTPSNSTTQAVPTAPAIPAIPIDGSWFSKHAFLQRIRGIKQYFIGVSKYTDTAAYTSNQKTGNGILHTLLTIWEKDSGKLSLAFTALLAYANKDSLASTFPELGEALRTIKDSWQRLKGYEVKRSSRYEIIQDITLDDERIIGLDDQKEELKHTLEYLANPQMYDAQKSGPGRGIIIVGPSGNGKTLLVRALAGSANQILKNQGSNNRISFKEIKWAEVAWTREGMKKMMRDVAPHAPCFVFFDEIHTLPLQTKENTPTLSDFLTELDGVNAANSASNQIIFVAATNQPELLDKALLRSGRFGTVIRVKQPNFAARKQYFEVMCQRYSIDTTAMDLDLIARQTNKCSYSDLDSILKDARFTARRELRTTNQNHILDRIKKRVYRIKEGSTLNDFEKKHLAANKAGSALIHLLLDPQEQLELVTIKGRWKKIKESRYWDNEAFKKMATAKNIKYGAIFTYNPNEELAIIDENEKITQCKIKIAGYLAEEALLKSKSSQNCSKQGAPAYLKNRKKALELITSMKFDAFEKKFLSKKRKQELKEELYETLKHYETEVRDILDQNHLLLEKIFNELQDKELLTAAQLKSLMTNV